jgi:hypothetical protein
MKTSNAIVKAVKTFLAKNNLVYLHLYREKRSKASKTAIDGRQLKFYQIMGKNFSTSGGMFIASMEFQHKLADVIYTVFPDANVEFDFECENRVVNLKITRGP